MSKSPSLRRALGSGRVAEGPRSDPNNPCQINDNPLPRTLPRARDHLRGMLVASRCVPAGLAAAAGSATCLWLAAQAGVNTSLLLATSLTMTAVAANLISHARPATTPKRSLIVILALLVGAGWLWQHHHPLVSAALAAGAAGALLVSAVAGIFRGRWKQRMMPAARASAALALIMGDTRPPGSAITPAGGKNPWPMRWHPPTPLDPDRISKTLERLVTVTGPCHGEVEVGPGTILLHEGLEPVVAPEKKAAPTISSRLRDALQEQLKHEIQVSEVTLDRKGVLTAPAVVRWKAETAGRLSDDQVRLKIQRTVENVLGVQVHIQWEIKNDQAIIMSPHPPPDFVNHPPRPATVPPGVLPFGIAPDGKTASWDMNSRPHMLIDGTTGSGKTVFLRAIVVAALQDPSIEKIVIIDPKRVGLVRWERHPKIVRYSSPEQMRAALTKVLDEMERRYDALEKEQVLSEDLKRWLVIMDEGQEFFDAMARLWKIVEKPQLEAEAKEAKKSGELASDEWRSNESPAVGQFSSGTRLGREGGIHFLVASQQVGTDWMPTGVRGCFGIRGSAGSLEETSTKMILGGVAAQQVSYAVTNDDHIKGRMWIVFGNQPVRVQIFWTPNPKGATDEEKEHLESLLGKEISSALTTPPGTPAPPLEPETPHDNGSPTDDTDPPNQTSDVPDNAS